MTLVTTTRNLSVLWVGVEATTLSSAPLIYFHRHRRSLEATWKYLVICSVGIALALLGNILFSVAFYDPANPIASMVRDAPNPEARILASVGPNTRVVATEYSLGFTRVDIDDGRLVGWVPSEVLGASPVRERKRSSAPAKRRENRPAAKPETPSTPATPEKQEAPATPAAPTTMAASFTRPCPNPAGPPRGWSCP